MNQLTEEIKSKILPLIKDKNFEKIEKIISTLNQQERETPFVVNLLGVCKVTKKNFNKDESLKKAKEAMFLFETAFKKDPKFIDALYNLAETSLQSLIYNDNLIFYLENYLKKVNYDFKTILYLARIHIELLNFDKAINYFKKILNKKETSKTIWTKLIFISNYSNSESQEIYLKTCSDYVKSIKKIDNSNLINFNNFKNPKKIRIGFFSSNFKQHSVTNFLVETIKALNVNNFETIAFNELKTFSQDKKTQELRQIFYEWHNIYDLKDLDAVNFIRDKSIDILFDLTGYTTASRLELFKYRSAPVQISWIGYTNSTGLKEMDYIITDPYVISKNISYTEKSLPLPNIWSCHSPINEKIIIEKLPALKNDYITYGSFNTFSKICDETISLWSELLKKSKSKLILKNHQLRFEKVNEMLFKKFQDQGVNLNNIKILKRTNDYQSHLKHYNKIDISLDPIVYNGATTSFESVWMGVPVMTVPGKTFRSRYGLSINSNLNLHNFIASDKRDFINKALLINSDLNKLSNLRKNLRVKVLNSPLFKSDLFSKGFINVINNINLK